MKKCSTCEQQFPATLEFFHRFRGGLTASCKACRSESAARSYAKHKDKYRARKEQYAKDNAEAARERGRRWYLQNRDRRTELTRRWIEAHPQKWADIRREVNARRRAVQAGVPSEKVDRAEIFLRDQGICGICQQPVDPDNWHLDHVVPVSLGGGHLKTNVQVSHPFCNQSKGGSNRPADHQPRAAAA